MTTIALTDAQEKNLRLVEQGKVVQKNCGHGAWRIFGGHPSVIGRLVSMGLVKWDRSDGDPVAVLSYDGAQAIKGQSDDA